MIVRKREQEREGEAESEKEKVLAGSWICSAFWVLHPEQGGQLIALPQPRPLRLGELSPTPREVDPQQPGELSDYEAGLLPNLQRWAQMELQLQPVSLLEIGALFL